MGRNYGPIIVSGKQMRPESLVEKTVAIPGTLTTAFLALRMFAPDVQYHVVPFDKILDQVRNGKFDAGLLIHEGQLTYREKGLYKVLDLGEWWLERTGLPLPLGGNAIKRELGETLMKRVAQDIRKSIQYALSHREAALAYALQFARGMDAQRVDRFIGMYVNELTLDYGAEGQEAVRRLLDEAYSKNLIPKPVALEFI